MKARKRVHGWVLSALALMWIPAAQAQQREQEPQVDQPTTPVPSSMPSSNGSAVPAGRVPGVIDVAPQNEETDSGRQSNAPLTSVEPWGGLSRSTHNYIQPSFSIYEGGDTNPYLASSGQLHPQAVTQVSGQLEVHRLKNQYETILTYEGDANFYTQQRNQDSTSHSLDIAQRFIGKRRTFFFDNRLTYSPESPFSYNAFNSLNLQGGATSLYDTFSELSAQSILTGQTRRIENNFVTELQYQVSRRSAVTFSGTYDILRFPETGFIDSNTGSVQLGYSRSVTPRDTLGIIYAGSVVWFGQQPQKVHSHALMLAYGRLLRERLAFEVSGGPQVNVFQDLPSQAPPRWSESVRTSLRYTIPRGYIRLSYVQDVSSGGGVFLGAQTHQARLAFARQLSRNWRINWGGGYAYNKRLDPIAIGGSVRSYNTWGVGATLARPVGRYARVSWMYNLSQQDATLSGLQVGRRQEFGMRFEFGFRSIELR
jgi:hypothetical protein